MKPASFTAILSVAKMCSLCGAFGKGPAWERTGVADSSARWQLRRESMESAQCVSDLLSARRIKVTANPNHGFVVVFPTGGAAIAGSLAEIWHILSRRDISIPDPLEIA